MDSLNIAVFGCWNEGCKENSGQRSVVQILKKNEDKYKFMVILGDNYYADKIILNKDNELKAKLTNLIEAKSGFECLKNINLEKKLIMGNHDVQDSLDKGCSILKTQLKLPWYDVKFPYSYDFYYLKNENIYQTILFIYLDTTIYDEKINDDNSCYKSTINKTIDQLKEEQKNFIKKTLEITINKPINFIKNIVFFGHEPLLTYKDKKVKDSDESIVKLSILKELLDLLFEEKIKYSKLNFYWICADYHIYQNTEIINNKSNDKITQWIFGTGGGELDIPGTKNYFDFLTYHVNILPNIVFDSNNNDISNIFTSNGLNRFGYGEIIFDLCSVKHKFIMSNHEPIKKDKKDKKDKKINEVSEVSELDDGFKKKYFKYKNKYIKFKNRLI